MEDLTINPGDDVIVDLNGAYEAPRFYAHRVASVTPKTVTVLDDRFGRDSEPRRMDRHRVFAVLPAGVSLASVNDTLKDLKDLETASVKAAREAYKASALALAATVPA